MSSKSTHCVMGFQVTSLRADLAVPMSSSPAPTSCVPASSKASSDALAQEFAPLLVGGWTPSKEQREKGEHFGNTGDVFDLLAL